MLGRKLSRAKAGLTGAMDAIAANNHVGLITFGDRVDVRMPIMPAKGQKGTLREVIAGLKAEGETALYDAIKAGIEMSDAAEGDPSAIRAVVVVTDGRANRGSTRLDELVRMTSKREVEIRSLSGYDDETAVEVGGRRVPMADVLGNSLALSTRHPVQVFVIAIGKDADLQVARIIADATGAEFLGTTEADMETVLQEFSKYF
jgi:Mg-chelatase subunit ChlD